MNLLENIDVNIIALDKAGTITFANAACLNELGQAKSDIIGKNAWKLNLPLVGTEIFHKAVIEVLEKPEAKSL